MKICIYIYMYIYIVLYSACEYIYIYMYTIYLCIHICVFMYVSITGYYQACSTSGGWGVFIYRGEDILINLLKVSKFRVHGSGPARRRVWLVNPKP